MKKNSKDIWFIIAIILGIVGIWGFMYFQGELDDKLPSLTKKEIFDKNLKKIKEILPEKKIEIKEISDKKEVKNEQFTKNTIVKFETSFGNFEVELYKKLMPITAGNFEKLVKEDFYNGIRFHRVIKDFMIQAGDPNSKDLAKKYSWGKGGPGYTIEDEYVKNEKLSNKEYTISMANSGPQTGGSQFFINTKNNDFLDFNKEPLQSKHPVFGKIVSGFDTVDKIEESQNGEVIIKKAYIK